MIPHGMFNLYNHQKVSKNFISKPYGVKISIKTAHKHERVRRFS